MIKKKSIRITMKAMQSSCCGGGFNPVCSPDFIGDKKPGKGSTCHYECAVCGKPCDVEPTDGGNRILLTVSAQKRAT